VIKNSRSHEKAFWFVAFLLVERENFLHAIRSVLLPETLFFTACFGSTSGSSEVVLGKIDFLQRSDPQVSRLRVFWLALMCWLVRTCSSVEQGILPLDVELIRLWDGSISALPPLEHNLREISLRRCLNVGSTKFLHPVGRSIVAADLPLRALFRGFR